MKAGGRCWNEGCSSETKEDEDGILAKNQPPFIEKNWLEITICALLLQRPNFLEEFQAEVVVILPEREPIPTIERKQKSVCSVCWMPSQADMKSNDLKLSLCSRIGLKLSHVTNLKRTFTQEELTVLFG